MQSSVLQILKSMKVEPPQVEEEIFDSQHFLDQTLDEVVIKSSVTRIGNYAFAKCYNLKRVVFEKRETPISLGEGVFHRCYRLEEVVDFPKMKCLPPRTFSHCLSLEKIDLQVEQIARNALSDCIKLHLSDQASV